MTTACYRLVRSIPDRVEELWTLVGTAKGIDLRISAGEPVSSEEHRLYNALCRATCVLLASHLEGFLKELVASLVEDLNYNLRNFSEMPNALKHAFCMKIAFYEGVPKDDIDARVTQLQAFFSKNSIKLDLQAFTYKENGNKNPSANFIDSSLSKFGIRAPLASLGSPAYLCVFDGQHRSNVLLYRNLKRLMCKLYKFPPKPLPARFAPLKILAKKSPEDPRSLWHDFVDNLMVRRHIVAHGDTYNNDVTWEELSLDLEKLTVLMYGLTYVAAAGVSRQMAVL
jgi:hypothetical protein